MIKKQTKWLLIGLGVILVLGVSLIVLFQTVLKPQNNPLPDKGNHGETLINGRPLLFDQVKREDLGKLTVTNANGGYVLYTGTDGELYFQGAESLLYDSYGLSEVVTNTGYLVADQEVVNYHKEDLSVYGLAQGQSKASFTIQRKSDPSVSYTVYLGNPLTNNNGYYAMLEGRDALYVINNYQAATILADVRTFLSTQVALPAVPDSENFIHDLIFYKDGKELLTIQPSVMEGESDEALTTQVLHAYRMNKDGEPVIWVNDTAINTVVQGIKDVSGDMVVEYSVAPYMQALYKYQEDPNATPDSELGKKAYKAIEILKKYGLMNEDFSLRHTVNYTFKEDTSSLIYSDCKDGVFYVYSEGFDVIVEFAEGSHPWLFWGPEEYKLQALCSYSVYDLAEFEVTAPSVHANFVLTNGTGEKKGKLSKVVDTVSQKEVNVDLFKMMYRGFLYFSSLGEAQQGEVIQPSLTVRYRVMDGTELEFVFYDITDRKSFFTVNGVGGGYVNRDYVRALITYTQNVLDNVSFSSGMV